jgi:Type I restriction-modification system methyltransferase subunit
MVKLVPDEEINTVIDLSMGECGLLEAAKKRWNHASFYGADIDETLLCKINAKSPYIHTFNGDSLSEDIADWTDYQNILERFHFDLAIANPPFNYHDQATVYIDDGLDMVMPIEMRFLFKYMDIVRAGGYISIILPYGFLSLDLYEELRLKILSRVTIIKIVKIFENCFDKIDADTCLVVMQKKRPIDRYIQKHISVEYLDSSYRLVQHTDIEISDNLYRLDLEYHKSITDFEALQKVCKYPAKLLDRYVCTCKRGRTLAGKKELIVIRGVRFLHTTDIKFLHISNTSQVYVLKNSDYFKGSKVELEDVLIGRVGKGCIGKVALVTKKYPNAVISDCIFCLRVKSIDPYYLTLYLASKFGQIQLKGLAKGSCSKYITKEDLLHIKVIALEESIQLDFRNRYQGILSRSGRTNKEKHLRELVAELENIIGRGD